MGTLIRKSILFVLVTVAGYILILFLWGLIMPGGLKKNLIYRKGGKGHMYSRMEELKNERNIDVLFIGSSLAARGFDTRVFKKHGYKTFNLGSGGQTPIQSEWLLKKYIDQLNPKFIIYEVNPYVLSRDGVEPAVDLISNHDFDWSLFKMAFEINNMKVYNAFIFSLCQSIVNPHQKINEPKVKGKDTYVTGGYLERKISYFGEKDLNEEIEYSLIPMDYQKESLIRSVKYIESKNIDYRLMQPPLTHLGFDQYKVLFHDEQFFKDIGKYINFYNYVEMNDTLHFFDSRHLNQYGVEIFDEAVIKVLLDTSSIKKRIPE